MRKGGKAAPSQHPVAALAPSIHDPNPRDPIHSWGDTVYPGIGLAHRLHCQDTGTHTHFMAFPKETPEHLSVAVKVTLSR